MCVDLFCYLLFILLTFHKAAWQHYPLGYNSHPALGDTKSFACSCIYLSPLEEIRQCCAESWGIVTLSERSSESSVVHSK